MNRLLLISYFFPPYGGAGVQRALKLARVAPEFDWTVVAAISATPGKGEGIDPTLVPEIPRDCEVSRTDVVRAGGLSRWVGPWMTPDPYVGWLPGALEAARSAIMAHEPHAILSTSMPYTCHLVGLAMKREFGLPWVADLRDPWTDNRFLGWFEGNGPRARFRRWADGAMEKSVYAEADLVTVTAAPLADLLVSRHGVPASRVMVARNGYDEDDFAGHLPLPAPKLPMDTQALRVLFAGSIYVGYTFEPFMAALEHLLRETPDAPISFSVVTQNQRLFERFSPDYPLALARTTIEPRVPHAEVIARYGQADLMVLSCLDDLSTPGKLFENIRCGTPVLAFAVANAEAHMLLRDTATGWCVPHDDPVAGAQMLRQLLAKWQSGQALAQPDGVAVARLERRVAYRAILDRLALLARR